MGTNFPAGGTVNMVPASANLSRHRSQVAIRADNTDGYRASLDVNRVVLPNKLSVRFTELYQHDGFVLKPSGTSTERYSGMIKYHPWKGTTISASYSKHRQWGNRPNAAPPRDSVSYWLASGCPTWDPVAQVVHVDGRTLGPFTSTTGLPDYFNNSFNGPAGPDFFSTPRHTLVGQAGWLRENAHRFQRNITGQGVRGQNGQLLIDVNERMLDGSDNPFLLRPYIGVNQPLSYEQPARWDTYRGQLAYKLDLSKEHNRLKWLGWHQLTGYDEYKYRIKRQYGFRDVMADSHTFLPAGVPRANQDTAPGFARPYFRYYVGDNQGANVDYGSPNACRSGHPSSISAPANAGGRPTTAARKPPRKIMQRGWRLPTACSASRRANRIRRFVVTPAK